MHSSEQSWAQKPPEQLCPGSQATAVPHSRQPSRLESPQVWIPPPAPAHLVAPETEHSLVHVLSQKPFEQTSARSQATASDQPRQPVVSGWQTW